MADDTRQRLADLMERRRLDLDLRWEDVSRNGGVSLNTLFRARNGSADILPLTGRKIDKGLRWQPGSIDAILDGGDPTPLPENGGRHRRGPATIAALDDPRIRPYAQQILDEGFRARNEDEARVWDSDQATEDERLALIAGIRWALDGAAPNGATGTRRHA